METFVTATAVFWGSHTLKDHPICGRDCGHTWTVEMTITGDEDEEFHGFPEDEGKFLDELEQSAAELNGKDIDKMVKPAFSSPVGIAHWFYERFAIRYKVVEVTVWHSNFLRASLRA